MIETPIILQTAAQKVARVHLTVPRAEIQHVMMPGLNEIKAVLEDQGIKPTGPWFTHHLQMSPEVFDFEICLPVDTSIKAVGRVQAGEIPSVRAARTVYHGDFEGLGDAWGQFMDWIETNHHRSAPDLLETYLAGPESSPDPANWATQLTRPLLD